MRAPTKRPAPSLAAITIWFIAASATVAIILLYVVISDRVRQSQREALQAAVTARASGVQAMLARVLYEDWRRLKYLSSALETTNPDRIGSQLDAIVGDGNRISWAGYARVDGTVEVASAGMLKGQDVSERPWFQHGLEGPFAGDVHEAKLLANLLPRQGDEPLRFLDMAIPVVRDGETLDVLAMHLNFEWARQLTAEIARSLSIDAFVINRNGRVVIATDGQSHDGLDLPSVRAAATGARSSFFETWPDGQAYFAASVPDIAYADLPSFGWRLVARIPADAISSAEEGLSLSLIFYLATFGMMLFLISAIFVQSFIRPFAALARNAERVAEGREVFPYESNRTRELRMIGSALAKLQLNAFGSEKQDRRA